MTTQKLYIITLVLFCLLGCRANKEVITKSKSTSQNQITKGNYNELRVQSDQRSSTYYYADFEKAKEKFHAQVNYKDITAQGSIVMDTASQNLIRERGGIAAILQQCITDSTYSKLKDSVLGITIMGVINGEEELQGYAITIVQKKTVQHPTLLTKKEADCLLNFVSSDLKFKYRTTFTNEHLLFFSYSLMVRLEL